LREAGARVIGSCRFVAEPWKRFVGQDRVHVVYNGVAGGPEVPRCNPVRPPMVGCIGRIAPEKGQLEFARVAGLVHRARKDCRFVIYGAAVISEPGYEQAVRDAARGLPIEFAGWTCDVPGALQKLDLLLAPSGPHEATTRTILEAFATGTPVIAFASGGIPEVIEHGRTGLLASGPEEMAQHALALLGDAEQRRAIAAAAREEWRIRFRLEDWQTGVLDFLATL
jgi:glycosyltransferase involved in cell wall biosynthesis